MFKRTSLGRRHGKSQDCRRLVVIALMLGLATGLVLVVDFAASTIVEGSVLPHYSLPTDVINFAKDKSIEHGYVYLLFFNLAYADFVKSWICNIRLVDPTVLLNTLFVAADDAAALSLFHIDPALRVHVQAYQNAEASSYGTYPYFRLTLERLFIQNVLIQAEVNVFLFEADAVWFSSIAEYAHTILKNNDIVSADDRGNGKPLISAGFLFFNSKNKFFFRKYVAKYASNLKKFEYSEGRFDEIDPGEQHLMTKLLKAQRLKVYWLDECHFARGEWYEDKNFRARCPVPKVIQNNYVEGNKKKIDRAKRWGHWFLNPNGTCIRQMPLVDPSRTVDLSCQKAFVKVSGGRNVHGERMTFTSWLSSGIRRMPEIHPEMNNARDIFSLVDHVFFLAGSTRGCKNIRCADHQWKTTCVNGRELDACLFPDEQLRTYMDYSELAASNHAYVHLYSAREEHDTIAVVEEDFKMRGNLTSGQLASLDKLLRQKNDWSFIRVGRRPYFLERRLNKRSCPEECICERIPKYGDGLCRMRRSGCDMRSSDFYIANQNVLLKFAELTNDDTDFPWQRVENRKSPSLRYRRPLIDVEVLPSFANQWYLIPQMSYQTRLRDTEELYEQNLGIEGTLQFQERHDIMFRELCVV
mmetsp:Transcript_3700/g.17028  ORF Transcript_3700/g.17028 Transcript_3700/m.17028 type:complete len:639 (+) Transcript_3700:199-2115(+)